MNTDTMGANTCIKPSPLMQGEPPRELFTDWVLLKGIDFFGTTIKAGTVFKQKNPDYYRPAINSAQCPHYQISFMIVKNNPEYFLQIQK